MSRAAVITFENLPFPSGVLILLEDLIPLDKEFLNVEAPQTRQDHGTA
jgi:hypothetical protein